MSWEQIEGILQQSSRYDKYSCELECVCGAACEFACVISMYGSLIGLRVYRLITVFVGYRENEYSTKYPGYRVMGDEGEVDESCVQVLLPRFLIKYAGL